MQHLDPLRNGPQLENLSIPAAPSHTPRIPKLFVGIASSVVLTLGCAPQQEMVVPGPAKKPEKVLSKPAKPVIKPEPTAFPAADREAEMRQQREQELKVYQALFSHAKEVNEEVGALEILIMEQGLEGGKFDKELELNIQKAHIRIAAARFRSVRSIIEAPPESWARLITTLVKIIKKEELPKVEHLDDLKALGPLIPSDSKEMERVQLALYKLLVGDLAAVVASVDTGLRKIQEILILRLSPELRERVQKHYEEAQAKRVKMIQLLQNGGLFPVHPAAPEGLEKVLLDHFDTVRDEKGGLPKGNAVRPSKIIFGPGQQSKQQNKPSESDPKPAQDDSKPSKPKRQYNSRTRAL